MFMSYIKNFGDCNYSMSSSFLPSDIKNFEDAESAVFSKYSTLGNFNTLKLLYFVSKYYVHPSFREFEEEYYKCLDSYTGEKLLLFFDFLAEADKIGSIKSVREDFKRHQPAYQGVVRRNFAGYFTENYNYSKVTWFEDTKRKIIERYAQKLEPIYAKQREEEKDKEELTNISRKKTELYINALEAWRKKGKFSKKIVKRPLTVEFGLTDEDLELCGYNDYNSKANRYNEYLRALHEWNNYKGLQKRMSSYPTYESFDLSYEDVQSFERGR